jgi:4-alpha-glucanotransferase
MLNQRSSGILLHPTSLPGKFGIGTLGKEAFHFIDFLAKSGQRLWQTLPLGPTGFGDSPYQSFSSSAGNPLLIDPELLAKEGLLDVRDLRNAEQPAELPVDYSALIPARNEFFHKAFEVFKAAEAKHKSHGFDHFTNQNSTWLNDYALFMALRDHYKKHSWQSWEKPLKMRDPKALQEFSHNLADKILYHKFLQYHFFRQWFAVKDYAHKHGVRIIGDIPIYVSPDSVDIWVNPTMFLLDKDLKPTFIGGVPPDYFSETGQLWGNPLYNWEAIMKDGCRWWIRRFRDTLAFCDIIRIDHFRGFAGFWAVPSGEKTAVNGEWMEGPGNAFFTSISKALGDIPVIAEDLGVITDDVVGLRDSNGFPGMKILQFAFDSAEENDHLTYNFSKNSVVYTGTHDNNTTRGWFDSAPSADRELLLEFLNADGSEICWDMIRLAWGSVANTAIVPMQDLLCLGTEARMNLPGTTRGNWQWRAAAGCFSNELAAKLRRVTEIYGRNRKRTQ